MLENFKALEIKSDDTLYFVYDEENNSTALYLGSRLIAGTGEIIGSDSLSGLNDVLIKAVADKDILIYDSVTNNWVNISLDELIEKINKDNNYATEEAFSELSAIVENNYSSLLEGL